MISWIIVFPQPYLITLTWYLKSSIFTTQSLIRVLETTSSVTLGTLPHTEEPGTGAGAGEGDSVLRCGHDTPHLSQGERQYRGQYQHCFTLRSLQLTDADSHERISSTHSSHFTTSNHAQLYQHFALYLFTFVPCSSFQAYLKSQRIKWFNNNQL